MTQLQSAVVLITGAAGGFGQELTRQLLQKGSRLILTDRPEVDLRSQASQLQATLGRSPGEIIDCLSADLANSAGCEELYRQTQALNLPIDVLINNAGIAILGHMVDIPPERWEQLMEINLMAPMRLSTRFAADMVARRRGHIVNISSLAGWIAMPGLTAYAASKFGLRGFSEGLRHEVAPHEIKVTTVCPCFSRTPMLQCDRFGLWNQIDKTVPIPFTTDPARVMTRTVRAIERNQSEVFPDAIASSGRLAKCYLPALPDWISRQIGLSRQSG
ncbi:SDR family NAD(P)-dependent oxidoreductase [Nodosilinea sp. PGN35]|uniref:SDR family NAD(P)-dependent oxidoreductase n=1 Tax=Nodosilinea sp. PGN35 TaxID=3020489 RepID=UPI0023B2E178|nr:SDR family NAD(P)-dependent oxidoreductase [Nodosilinea sp. TSF1-S3]MDF0365134.1 SDR family NAD(P)-dependent oxidoreductase [Nodosilinea sp. TSF1-S3]